jgi:hypothetical protein
MCPSLAFLLRFLGIVGTLSFILLLQLLHCTYIQALLQVVFLFTLSAARRMVGIITLTVLGAGLTILKLGIDLRRNIEKAKSTGLPYIVGREFNLSFRAFAGF